VCLMAKVECVVGMLVHKVRLNQLVVNKRGA
jgi:hypothetical protein